MNKSALRKIIRDQKRNMSEEQIIAASKKLGQLLRESALYHQARTVYFYLPYNQEVRTVPMLEQAIKDGKRVAVPKVYGDEMRFIYLEDLTAIAPGSFGIPEPIADAPVADDPFALIIMPGLAFDRNGNRIGYGGGFYDKFLAKEPKHPTVALCYGFQLVDSIEADDYDIPVDEVLSCEVLG